ncbi:MAG: hypothetical protein GF364_17100 [Candidatus Lokiarchaeota archaeon]|nr:hypothetical protein [Candidatus Lokiarchaeota archaeon]
MESKIARIIDKNNETLNSLLFESDSIIKAIDSRTGQIEDRENRSKLQFKDVKARVNLNLHKFSDIIDYLVEFWGDLKDITGGAKYKETVKKLTSIKNEIQTKIKQFGALFINKHTTKIAGNYQIPRSIANESWLQISEEIRDNTQFQEVIENIEEYTKDYYNTLLDKELEKVKRDYPQLDEIILEDFKDKFLESQISFEDYFDSVKTKLETEKKRKKGPKTLEEEEYEEKLRKIQEDFDNYEAYMNADERTLRRMKRKGIYNLNTKKQKRRIRRPKNSDDEK